MATWLAAVARHMSGRRRRRQRVHGVDGDRHAVPSGIEGALTPMGAVSLQWLRETADATEADLLARAAGFFPWWEPGVHEQARVGVGRVGVVAVPVAPAAATRRPRSRTSRSPASVRRRSSLGPGGAISHRDIEELAT